MESNIYFISGIDTDAGKSYCTAWYAKQLSLNGQRIITQKSLSRPEIQVTPKTLICTGASWEQVICLKIKKGSPCPKYSLTPVLPTLPHILTTALSTLNKIERSTPRTGPSLRYRIYRGSRWSNGSFDRRISHH